MRFTELPIPGAFTVDLDLRVDDRGLFARTYCREEFRRQGLCTDWAMSAVAFNRCKGTLRGLHYQADPHPEIKLVHCTRGVIFDVIVDLRLDSPVYGTWQSVILSAGSGRLLYIPTGVAHGYQTLSDGAEVAYQISSEYHANLQRGIRWSDESLAIAWPDCTARIVSPRDQELPTLTLIQSTNLATCP